MEKKVKRTDIFKGKVIHVTHDEVELDDGNTAMREIVWHHGGVCVLAIEDGCILLVKQYRYAHQAYTLEIPAGKLEPCEKPEEACYREFEEETDRRAKHMRYLFKMLPTPGYSSETDYLYEAEDFHYVSDSRPADADEFLKIIKLPLAEAYQKVLNEEIVDCKTIIAILYACNRQKKLD